MGAKCIKVIVVALMGLTYLTHGDLQGQQTEQAVNTSQSFLRGASVTSSNDTYSQSNFTLEAEWGSSIVGGKIELGNTGLCLAHENNWFSTNRVKTVACYGRSDVLWTIKGDHIKSYQNAQCFEYLNTRCLEYKRDGYVYLEKCNPANKNQLWEL